MAACVCVLMRPGMRSLPDASTLSPGALMAGATFAILFPSTSTSDFFARQHGVFQQQGHERVLILRFLTLFVMAHAKAGYRKMVFAAALIAVACIAILAFLSETPTKLSVGQALTANNNTVVQVQGQAKNVTICFLLCENRCISVDSDGLPAAALLENGREATVVWKNNAIPETIPSKRKR